RSSREHEGRAARIARITVGSSPGRRIMRPRLKAAACGLALALLATAPALAALKPGEKAPAFTAPAYLAGQPFTYDLSEALEKGPVVLYFFPAAHTPGCSLEAHLFSEAIDDFAERGASVIGVTAGNTDE